jgi:uncharacterized membrane protein
MDSDLEELKNRVSKLEGELAALKKQLDRTEPAQVFTAPPKVAPKPATQTPSEPVAPVRGESLEESLVGTWFPRIGAVAILIGAGFAFKYAVDQGLIGPAGRVALGIVAGVGFLIWGWWTESRGWSRYAQAVTSGGIALLYLSILAAFHLYSLVPERTAFSFLILVSLLNAGLAYRYDAQPLAVLAVLGAFMNPFLLSLEPGDPRVLYFYAVLVDAAVIGLASVKRWRVLEFEALFGTWLIFIVGLGSADTSLALTFAGFFFLLFHSVPYLRTHLSNREVQAADLWILVPNALIYLSVGLYLLDSIESWQGPFVLSLAVIHLLLGVLLDKEQRLLKQAQLGLSIFFFTIWLPIQFDGFLIATGWALKGALIVWLGLHYKSRRSVNIGIGVLGLGLLGASSMLSNTFDADRLFLNWEAANVLGVIACITAASILLARTHEEGYRKSSVIGAIAANVLALSWLTAEITDYFGGLSANERQAFQFALSATWAMYAAALLVIGVAMRLKWARLFAAGLLGFTILKMALVDLWTLQTGYRVLAFTGLGAVLLLTSLMYHRFKQFLLGEESVIVGSIIGEE